MSTHFDLKRSGTQFMFNLKAANNEIVLTGVVPGYGSK